MGQKNKRNRSHKPHKTRKPKFQHPGRKNRSNKHDLPADEWTQAQQELDQQLRKLGLYCKEIAGDGNCLFRSLSDQFYGNTKQHSKIRKEICEYLERNRDHFQYFVEDDKTFDYHLSQMKKDGTYGGNMELVGFAQLHGVDIKIYQPGTIYVIEGNEIDNGSTKEVRTRRTLHIIYHSWEHYSSVRNIQGPHSGDPKIISESINNTNNSIEKMIMDSTGERNLTKIREMMEGLHYDHDEVINELIESSQKNSINDNGSNSIKAVDEIMKESVEDPQKNSINGDGSNSKKAVDEIMKESVEDPQKNSINDDGSNSKKAVDEIMKESVEDPQKNSINDDGSNSKKADGEIESIESSQKSSNNNNTKEAVDEVTNESIENSQKSSNNDDGSNSKKAVDEDTNKSVEDPQKSSINDNGSNSKNVIEEDTKSRLSVEDSSHSFQSRTLTHSEMESKKRTINDSLLNDQPLSKKEKRKLLKKQNRQKKNNDKNDNLIRHKDKIESSQNSSINVDSKMVIEEDTKARETKLSIEDPSHSFQCKTTTRSEMESKKRTINDSLLNQPLSKKEKRLLKKQQQNNNYKNDSVVRHNKDNKDKVITQLYI